MAASQHIYKRVKKGETKKERLLKFQQKLVEYNGLPPSRIMMEMQTPKLSSAKEDHQRRKLEEEYDKSAVPKVPEPMLDTNNHFGDVGAGDTSRIEP